MKRALTLTALLLAASVSACATGHYTPLAEAERDQVEQLKENVFRVEYEVNPFTSQERLDSYLKRRCAELTILQGYDYFHLGQRFDVLMLSRRTSITVTMFRGELTGPSPDFHDARVVLGSY